MSAQTHLPSVDYILTQPELQQAITVYGRSLTLSALRATLESFRQTVQAGEGLPPLPQIVAAVIATLQAWAAPSLYPLINATGVILHTNLGRAPLSETALQMLMQVSSAYCNLEFDLQNGKRGSRLVHADYLLQQITQAEAGMVVNNNASAVMLALSALAKGKKAAIARSQLVEIGGGFRVPDVMRQSGVKLMEIGTTNRLNLQDYAQAIDMGAAVIVLAHASNFKIIGFTEEPALVDVVRLAHAHHLPVIYDLGSGALLDTAKYGLMHEPTVQEALAAGCDLVCFSGDKLLGGPQAGLLVGHQALIEKCRKHPLARAIRADKLCLAALNATLLHYLKDEAEQKIPLWQMISLPLADCRVRALQWQKALAVGEVMAAKSTIGGGSLPTEELDTWVLALSVKKLKAFMALLRQQSPPIIARIAQDYVLFDPRTVLPSQEGAFISGLSTALTIHTT